MADTAESASHNVPMCVEGIKAAFQEFLSTLEAVLQTEEKRLGLERNYLAEQRSEAEAWLKQSADQFRMWKAATERAESLCVGMTQERESLGAASESARKVLIHATAAATGCSDPLAAANHLAALARMDASTANLDAQHRLPTFDLPPAAFDSVLPPTPSMTSGIRLPGKEAPLTRNLHRAPATSTTGVVSATATEPDISSTLFTGAASPFTGNISPDSNTMFNNVTPPFTGSVTPDLIVAKSPPHQLVTPVKPTSEGGCATTPPASQERDALTKAAPVRTPDVPPLPSPARQLHPMPDEPDEELVPSREGTVEQRRPGDLWVLHEELDI